MNYRTMPIEHIRKFVWADESGVLRCPVTDAPVKVSLGTYYYVYIERVQLIVHRVVFALHYGRWPEGVLDHINGDPLDNRIANLRECEQWQNAMNKRYHRKKGPYDLPLGVSNCAGGKYKAKLMHKNITHVRGPFNTVEEAAQAYRDLSNEIRGEFSPFWSHAA
jgi:hypothetical protein